MDEKRLQEILRDFVGEIPSTVTVTGPPVALALLELVAEVRRLRVADGERLAQWLLEYANGSDYIDARTEDLVDSVRRSFEHG